MTPKLIAIAPQIVVLDVVKTAEYYRDILGFTIIDYFMDPPVYAMVERDGFQVHFGKSNDSTIHINEQIRKGTCDFIIWVPEIDNFYDELKSKGADIKEGIVKRVYGSREFIIQDCDGHRILVGD
ncbi:MAG TPA: glyoxalase superfamily protein [Saprospiraceae bacterium]|nr:glyoxalase superfamily protein [Saprospiraceae bacterium]